MLLYGAWIYGQQGMQSPEFFRSKAKFSVQENAKLIDREKIDKNVFTFSGPALGVFLPWCLSNICPYGWLEMRLWGRHTRHLLVLVAAGQRPDHSWSPTHLLASGSPWRHGTQSQTLSAMVPHQQRASLASARLQVSKSCFHRAAACGGAPRRDCRGWLLIAGSPQARGAAGALVRT